MEIAFKLLVMVAHLAAVFAIAAWIADHMLEPKREKRQR